ncbi:LysM peptidoglycan-binding domain-containing protein [Aliikangiella sp. IMCC44653]
MTPSNNQATVDDVSLATQLNQNKQTNKAIHLLEKGQSSRAEKLLDEVLRYNPAHPTAILLKQQLNQSLQQLFNINRTTTYRVKSGDTLGKIAQEWLGNSLYFVVLAKLNNLPNSLAIRPGEKLVIPVTEFSQFAQKEKRRSQANIKLIKNYRLEKQYEKGLQKANTLFIVEQDLEKLLHEQQLTLDAFAKSSISLTERESMLKRLQKIAQSSRNLKQRELYQRFINAQNRLLFLDEALLLFEDKSYVQAAEKLVKAKALDKNMLRQTSVFRVEQLLLDKLHEQAVVLYRNHALKEAMQRWQLILKIQPENEIAQKYITRTQKLLEKLNQY